MNQRRSLIRKLAYMAAIAVLAIPLSWLSQPSVKDSEGRTIQGGKLAQQRDAYQLSQASLGEIDPASETIKLATLGMRGIAANLLWEKANEYKKVEDWTSLSATLEQITRLQPNVVSVWRFQGWNLSYNVAVEFDRYQDRYYWVIKGINFLKEGTRYNANEPMLLWDIGWFIGQKIGRADEKKQYRRLFKEDDDFHGSLSLAQRDNWLVGREYFLLAEKAADRKLNVMKSLSLAREEELQRELTSRKLINPSRDNLATIKGVSPLIFYSDPAMCLINYAETLEEEGEFGQAAKAAWQKAGDAWRQYGTRDIPTSYGIPISLNDQEKFTAAAKAASVELAKLTPPEVEKAVKSEWLTRLTEEERAIYDKPSDQRTPDESAQMPQIELKLAYGPLDIAERIQGEKRPDALRWAEAASQADYVAQIIDRYREIVNFNFWRLRCTVEQEDDTIAARKLMHHAEEAFRAARLEPAKQLYDEALAKWRVVLDKYPDMLQQNTVIEDLVESIDGYRKLLEQDEKSFPDPFVLQDVLEASGREPAKMPSVPHTTPEKK